MNLRDAFLTFDVKESRAGLYDDDGNAGGRLSEFAAFSMFAVCGGRNRHEQGNPCDKDSTNVSH